MHTLFVREHNRLADLIATHYPTATDDQIYHLARKLVGAEIQKITYSEFLPALMGSSNAPQGLGPADRATFVYDESADPRIANEVRLVVTNPT